MTKSCCTVKSVTQLVPQSSRKLRDKLNETLHHVTHVVTDFLLAKQNASAAAKSRTTLKFQLCSTTVAYSEQKFCPLRCVTRRNVPCNAPSRQIQENCETSCIKDFNVQDFKPSSAIKKLTTKINVCSKTLTLSRFS